MEKVVGSKTINKEVLYNIRQEACFDERYRQLFETLIKNPKCYKILKWTGSVTMSDIEEFNKLVYEATQLTIEERELLQLKIMWEMEHIQREVF